MKTTEKPVLSPESKQLVRESAGRLTPTITQVHRPALWEAACPDCTKSYREMTEDWLDAAFYSEWPSIDTGLQRLFSIHHGAEGHG